MSIVADLNALKWPILSWTPFPVFSHLQHYCQAWPYQPDRKLTQTQSQGLRAFSSSFVSQCTRRLHRVIRAPRLVYFAPILLLVLNVESLISSVHSSAVHCDFHR